MFTTSNGLIATVDDVGKVTAKSEGEATITATYNSLTTTVKITVTATQIELAPVITTAAGTLAHGVIGTDYSVTIEADHLPTDFMVSSGNLPEGLSINNNGVISGNPTTIGTNSFRITASNKTGTSAPVAFSIEIREAGVVSWQLLKNTIAKAELLIESDYPAELWVSFTSVLNSAKVIFQNENATQDEVDSTANSLIEMLHVLANVINHDYRAHVTEPTCEGKGFTTYTCSYCGDSYISDYVDALDHDFVLKDHKDATCEDGYDYYECSRCDETKTDVLPKTGEHVWNNGDVTAPTCTEQGYTAYICSVCDEMEKRYFVNALGHTEPEEGVVTTKPTYIEPGVRTYNCKVCNQVLRTEDIAPLDPTGVEILGIEVTYSTPSYSGSGGNHTGSTTVTMDFILSDGNIVTKTELFTGITATTSRAVAYNIIVSEVKLIVTVTTSGSNNQMSIIGATAIFEDGHPGFGNIKLEDVSFSTPTYTGNGSSRTGGATVNMEFTLPDDSKVTKAELFSGITKTTERAATYGLDGYSVTVIITVTVTGSGNNMNISGAAARISLVCGHSGSEDGVVTTRPTYIEPGVKTYYCKTCNKVLRTESIDPLDPTGVEILGVNVKYSAPSFTGNGGNRTGSTTVTMDFVLSDGNTVTKTELFSEIRATASRTVAYNIIVSEITVIITVTTSGTGNQLNITGATAIFGEGSPGIGSIKLNDVKYSFPTFTGNGGNRVGSTTVTMECILPDGGRATMTELFTGINQTTDRTVTYELGGYKVTVVITVTATGSNNSMNITGATAKVIGTVRMD